MKIPLLTVLLFCQYSLVEAQDLIIPIEGVYGDDYIIVNYPDWHVEEDGPVLAEDGTLRDFRCYSKTYDGHQGTDFAIRGFTQMDSSVNVLSIADGEVIHVTEHLYDRETGGIVALGLGNYVGIYHPSTDTYSYYAHLKTNSVPVEVGETVSAGQVIGAVGSSGNSTDPHLHFELWNPGVLTDPTIDPWGSPCDEGTNLWSSSPDYDTTYAIWECGLVNYDSVDNFLPHTWYALRERLDLRTGFTTDDPFFTFWALHYGLKLGDETRIEWYEPNGDLYSSSTTSYTTQDWWFHYYNHSIPTPPLTEQGIWTIRIYYNDTLQLTKTFPYGNLSVSENLTSDTSPYYYIQNDLVTIALPDNSEYRKLLCYDLQGKVVANLTVKDGAKTITLPQKEFRSGMYIISLMNGNKQFKFRIII